MTPPRLDSLRDAAIAMAADAGAVLTEYYGRLERDAISEKSRNDFVTRADQEAEARITAAIRRDFPTHHILAEESGVTDAEGDLQWVIDPLDGTTNFIRHIPVCGVSIAVRRGAEMLVGVVNNPLLGELFVATRGGGATLNGEPIRVSAQHELRNAFLATGFPHHSKRNLPQYVRAFADVFYYSAGARRLGAAALDLCYTACGRFDGFWEAGLRPWDMAAGALIVEEAGGRCSDFSGHGSHMDSGFMLAANPAVHAQLAARLSIYFGGTSS